MISLKQSAQVILKQYLNVKKGEKVLVISDKNLKKIGKVIAEQSSKITFTKLLVIPVGKQNGEEPSKEVAAEMKKYNVIIAPTTKSLSHTKARAEANKNARIVTMPSVNEDMMKRAIDVDCFKMSKLSNKLKSILDKGKEVRVTTKNGTDIRLSIDKRKAVASGGLLRMKDDFGNLPTGETFIAPLEGTADGRIVVDGSVLDKKVKKFEVIVEKGYAVRIGNNELNKVLKSLKDKDAFNIAELGIGTNEKAKITGNTLEDEKVKGTCHFAFGNNAGFGGKINVQVHIDAIIRNPTIHVDKKMIIENGKFLI